MNQTLFFRNQHRSEYSILHLQRDRVPGGAAQRDRPGAPERLLQ